MKLFCNPIFKITAVTAVAGGVAGLVFAGLRLTKAGFKHKLRRGIKSAERALFIAGRLVSRI